MSSLAMKKIDLNSTGIFLLPALIFVFGCFLHYQRGYYYTGLTSTQAQGADDAYISYRYGWNLAQFGRLSWNESGYRRTEGFTNPLWMYLSAVMAFGGRKEWVYPAMVIVSVLLSLLLLLMLIRSVYRANGNKTWAVMGLFFLAAAPVTWLHATSGLESAVFGLGLALLAYMVLFSSRLNPNPIAAFILAILLGFLRSDGFIYLGCILIAAWISGTKSWKTLAGGLACAVLGLALWRWLAFGSWLPNTATAKVNFSLIERIPVGATMLLAAMLYSGLLVTTLLGLAGAALEPRRLRLAILFVLSSWLAYYVFIGGDTYFDRHLVAFFTFAAACSAPLWVNGSRLARALLAIALMANLALSVYHGMGRFDYQTPKANDPFIMLGKALIEDRERYGVIVITAAGKIPFYAGGDFVDALGLNDPYLATLQRPQFIPGHSAGNDQAALELAKMHPSGVYSIFSYLDPTIIPSAETVALWVNNRQPQDEVQQGATEVQWQAALASGDPYLWSIISRPVQVGH